MRTRSPRSILAVLSVLTVPFVLSACQTAPSGSPQAPPSAAAATRRVILLSLDGAGADELHSLEQAGALTAGGFRRFFREGQVADRLVPVDPTLTAPNHISLATGYPPARTGIVGNNFHKPGASFLETVSGFAAPIETETLWEAARRQGKQVGVMAWPGADDTGERRRADWGMAYANEPYRRPELLNLARSRWEPAEDFAKWQGIESRSLMRGVHVELGGGQTGAQTFDLIAVDRTDDGIVNYDGVVALRTRGEGRPPAPPPPLNVGAWGKLLARSTTRPAPNPTTFPVRSSCCSSIPASPEPASTSRASTGSMPTRPTSPPLSTARASPGRVRRTIGCSPPRGRASRGSTSRPGCSRTSASPGSSATASSPRCSARAGNC